MDTRPRSARPRSAVRTEMPGVRSSTEFLERGGMVGSGQYSVTKNSLPSADSVPAPTPLVVPERPGSPPVATSPEALPSPGPPTVKAADLRAMVNALDESHDEAGAFAQDYDTGGQASPAAPTAPSARRTTPTAATPSGDRSAAPSAPAPVLTTGNTSYLEAVYSPKHSPTTSPSRLRASAGPSAGSSRPVGSGGSGSGGSRPRTALQLAYGPPPPTAEEDAEAVLTGGARGSRGLGSGSSTLLPEGLRPQYVSPQQPVPSTSGPPPSRGGSGGGGAGTGGAATDAGAASPSLPTPSKFSSAYGVGATVDGGRSASRAGQRQAAASTNAVASPPPQSPPPSAAAAAGGATSSGHGGGGGGAPVGSGTSNGAANVRDPGRAGGGGHGGSTAAAAVAANGRGSPSGGRGGSGGGGGRAAQGSFGAGHHRSPATAVAGAGAGQRVGRSGRSRREELFEETDPAVVLEQSIALLSEIEGLIRSSVDLPLDQPLDSISKELAIDIPTELLEALEDTLEVIAMAREEIAANEQRATQQRPPYPHHSQQPQQPYQRGSSAGASRAPGSHRPGSGVYGSSSYGSGGLYGKSGGGSGRHSRSGSASGAGLGGERSARGSWTGGAGGGAGSGPSQYLPPISSSVSVGSRASVGSGSSYGGRPPSHGISPSHSPHHQQTPPSGAQRSGSASRRGPRSSANGLGGGGSVTSIPSLAANLSNRRAWHKEAPPEEWVAQKQQRAEVERRKREAQLASDLKYLQQIRGRSAEVQQTHEALLAEAEESVRAARSAKASSEAQHRWLQYQETVAEEAKRRYQGLVAPGGQLEGAGGSSAYSTTSYTSSR